MTKAYNFAHDTTLYNSNKEFETVLTNLEINVNNDLAGFKTFLKRKL